VYSVDGTIFSPTRLPKHRDYVGSWIISSLNCLHRRDDWEQSYSTATGPNHYIMIGAFWFWWQYLLELGYINIPTRRELDNTNIVLFTSLVGVTGKPPFRPMSIDRFSTQSQFFLDMISLTFKRRGSAKSGNLFMNTFDIQTIHSTFLFIWQFLRFDEFLLFYC